MIEAPDVDCRLCKEPIKHEHIVTAVMVRVWVPSARQYQAAGPFHAECGKKYDQQITGQHHDK